MSTIRRTAARTLLAAGLAGVALIGGACAEGDGSISPGQEAPAEDPMAPADDGGGIGTTDGATTGAEGGTTTY